MLNLNNHGAKPTADATNNSTTLKVLNIKEEHINKLSIIMKIEEKIVPIVPIVPNILIVDGDVPAKLKLLDDFNYIRKPFQAEEFNAQV